MGNNVEVGKTYKVEICGLIGNITITRMLFSGVFYYTYDRDKMHFGKLENITFID